MTAKAEKRKFDRYAFPKTVQAFPVLPSRSGNIFEVQKQSLEVAAHDISEGGLRLETDRSFDPQFLLKLSFEVVQERPVEVFGKIIWSSEGYHGVRFMLADQELKKGIRAIGKKQG
jgi:hypothetical protein